MNKHALLLLVPLAWACTPSSSSSPSPPAQQTDAGNSADAGAEPDAGPLVRTVEAERPLLGTTHVRNLLWDPTFTSTESYAFLPLVEIAGSPTNGTGKRTETPTPTRSPALTVSANANSLAMALAPFHGGTGPFLVDVWVRGNSGAGLLDASDIEVEVGQAWVEQQPGTQVYSVNHVPEDDMDLQGDTWHHFSGTVDQTLPPACVFLVRLKKPGVPLRFAGPQVVPQTLVSPPPRARPNRGTVARPMAMEEQRAARLLAEHLRARGPFNVPVHPTRGTETP